MGIIRDFNNGRMEALRSISYSETGTQSPYVTNEPSVLNSLTSFFPDEISRRIDDTSRIAQMLVDKPGLKWIGNQTLLSRVELERKAREAAKAKRGEGGTGAGQVLAGFAAAAGQVLKIVGSTVAQVPVNGTGTHFVRGFTPDTYLKQGDPNGVLGFLGFDGENGAAKALNGETIILDGDPITGLTSFSVPDNFEVKKSGVTGGISKNTYYESSFFNPVTGGKDIINKGYLSFSSDSFSTEQRQQAARDGITIIGDNVGQSGYTPPVDPSPLDLKISNSGTASTFQSTLELSNPDILDPSKISLGVKTEDLKENNNNLSTDTERTTQLIDFRKLKNRGYRTNTYSLDYSDPKVIKEKRVGLGNQGKKKTIGDNYTEVEEDRVDKINQLGVQLKDLSNDPITKDFIPFNFELITPDGNVYLYFRAHLEQFSDSFNGDWGSTKYIGRAEDFYTYNGFSRQVSIGFKIAATSRPEMEPMYSKISTLASATAPTYGGSASPFMRGTLVRVTIGDYLSRVPGIIDSIDFNWQTDYPWEINAPLPNGEEDNMLIVPHVLDCNISFKPIHEYLPSVTTQRTPITRFIGNVTKAAV